ncbi:MAG: hypothetical protein A2X08_13450 [Bacteroidetes bacterium GWA2_32_17]|nr:MAG: hypothetical protein A2X08_13450 [Bacteroidetes bacterium GWA2_32_17]
MGRVEKDIFIHSLIEVAGLSEAGMRLSAFINLFENDWDLIKDFILDRFWLQLFKYESDFCGGNTKKESRSEIPKGKGIFNYKDLINEHKLIYDFYNVKITDFYREDDFEYDINDKLQYLIDRQAVFIGTKVKCKKCGSNKWYSYAELNSIIACKGCGSMITPQMETPIYYKLSEVITRNILSDLTKNSKDFDGNYTVLNALLWLKNDIRNCSQSFLYSPSMEYRTKKGRKSDIDILAIQDGRLVLGEAKNCASEFNRNEMEALAWLGNNVKPDKLILAYNEGKISEQRIIQLKSMLEVECEILEYKVEKTTYSFRGVFGQPSKITK